MVHTRFEIRNPTRNTLRNFSLRLSAGDFSVNDRHGIMLEESDDAAFNVKHESDASIFSFDYIRPKSSIQGFMISNVPRRILCAALEGVEVEQLNESNIKRAGSFIAFLSAILSSIAAATAILAIG